MAEETKLTADDIHNNVVDLSEKSYEIVISGQEDYDKAGEYLVDLAKMKKVVVGHFAKMKEDTHRAWKTVIAQEKTDLEPIQIADETVRGLRDKYADAEEKKRKTEQDRLDKEGREKAKKEEEKLQKKIDETDDEEEKQILEEKKVDVYAKPKISEKGVDKTSNVSGGTVSRVKDIEIEIFDENLLLKALVEGKVPATVYEFKLGKIKAWVKTNAIKQGQPYGFRIKEKSSERVRT